MNYFIKTGVLVLSITILTNCKNDDKGKIFIDSFIQNVIQAKGDCKMIKMESYIETKNYTNAQKKGAQQMFCLQTGSLYKHLKSSYTIKDILPYYQSKNENLPGFYEINEEKFEHVYFLKLDDNKLVPFKLNKHNDKIISMSAMDKGGNRRYLLEY